MKSFFRFALAFGAACGVSSASAAVVFDFSVTVEGSTPLGGSPFARLTIVDDGANRVRFTFENLINQSGQNRIRTLWFNIRPGVVAALSDSNLVQGGFQTDPQIDNVNFSYDQSDPQFNPGAGYNNFEAQINFRNGGDRLLPGESAIWHFSGTGLDETDFNFVADGSTQPPAYAMMHVLSDRFGNSIKIIAPGGGDPPDEIPGPAAVLPFAAAAIASLRRRRVSR